MNKNGLVANHAYTIFDTARVQNKSNRKVDLLRILSPHADRSKISKCKCASKDDPNRDAILR